MNLRAKCANNKCAFKGVERSVFVGQALGYGVANDRVKCPGCGDLMATTKTAAVRPRVKSRRKSRRDLSLSGRH
jgi:hypothetical protein